MAEIKMVPDAGPDPKLGRKRRVSGAVFPYYNLKRSIDVAQQMHTHAGGQCGRDQLAPLLEYNGVNNGSFLTRVTSAKIFGLVIENGDVLEITPRARAIIAPVTEVDADRAKVEAFMDVDLFKSVYEEFKGQSLPSEAGLQNLFETKYHLVKDRVIPAVKVMLQSAAEAGLFKAAGSSRMVVPLRGGASPAPPAPTLAQPGGAWYGGEVQRTGGGGGGAGGGGGGVGGSIHAAILGLLNELPPAGTAMTTRRRTALIDAFKATIGFIYPESDGEATTT